MQKAVTHICKLYNNYIEIIAIFIELDYRCQTHFHAFHACFANT